LTPAEFSEALLWSAARDLLGGPNRVRRFTPLQRDRCEKPTDNRNPAKPAASSYVAGPSAARRYLNEAAFANRQIAIAWNDYRDNPAYAQFQPSYEPHMSILNLLFHGGFDAP